MKKNIGNIDKIVRLVLTLLFAILYFTGIVEGYLGLGLLAMSAILFITSLMSRCPIYAVLGMSSCHTDEEDDE